MSELNFSIMDNNADFQQKTKQLREAITGLEADFTNPRHSGYPYPLSSSIRISRSAFSKSNK